MLVPKILLDAFDGLLRETQVLDELEHAQILQTLVVDDWLEILGKVIDFGPFDRDADCSVTILTHRAEPLSQS